MAYLHIDNLYKNQDVLLFRQLYALEKIHGTSAHVRWKNSEVSYFAGGSKHEAFVGLFDTAALASVFVDRFGPEEVVVYGEAYGGKMQRMSDTYGPALRFVVFEATVGKHWLAVPDAEAVAHLLGLDFVPYSLIPATLDAINAERDADSVQAIRNGLGVGHMREGIVLRPLAEFTKNNGDRVIAKHKRDEFRETASPREVDPARAVVLSEAQAIADEWVTRARLEHVLDSLGNPTGPEAIPDVIRTMLADVAREGRGEIIESKDSRKAIGSKAAAIFKAWMKERLATQVPGECP